MSELYLSLTREPASSPYVFKTTAIKVFSFEEALYHCFHYWKQSLDDFCCEDFIQWVNQTLKLTIISAKLREIAGLDSLCERLTAFLSLTDYFKQAELNSLSAELKQWESRLDWEKLKEQGDYFMRHDEFEKAQRMYQRALKYEKNCELLNNLAVSLMKQENFGEACNNLEQAVELCAENDERRQKLMFHFTECLILDGQLERAKSEIVEIHKLCGYSPDLFYYQGDIEYAAGNITRSLFYYEKAIEGENKPEYLYKLADVYVKTRRLDKAAEVLRGVEPKDKLYFKTLAEIHVQANNIPAAIKCMEQALVKDMSSVDVWTRLARYHRLNYDLLKAQSAITKSLNLSKHNEKACLEYARIRKAQGKTKEYQTILKNVLTGFKNRYRELD